MKHCVTTGKLSSALLLLAAGTAAGATLGDRSFNVQYNGRTGHLVVSSVPYGRFLDCTLRVPHSIPTATPGAGGHLLVTYPGVRPVTLDLAVDPGNATVTASARSGDSPAFIRFRGRIAWGPSPLICRLSPGPNPDVVQVALGPASNGRCNAVYSRQRDAGVVLSECQPTRLFYPSHGREAGVRIDGGQPASDLPLLHLAVRRLVRQSDATTQAASSSLSGRKICSQPAIRPISGDPPVHSLLSLAGYHRGLPAANEDEGSDAARGEWQDLTRCADRMAQVLYQPGTRPAGAQIPVLLGPPLSLDQARAWASFASLTGGAQRLGEPLQGLPKDRQDIARRLAPPLNIRPVDLYPMSNRPRVWDLCVAREGLRWDVVGVFNWDETPNHQALALEDLGLDPDRKYLAYDYWNQQYLGPIQGSLGLDLAPTSCRVLALRPALGRPQVVSTSQNITQGVGDLQSISWDATRLQLNGASFVTAGRPCCVQISVPDHPLLYRYMGEQTEWGTGTDQEAPGLVTLTLQTKQTGWVHWRANFAAFAPGPDGSVRMIGPNYRSLLGGARHH